MSLQADLTLIQCIKLCSRASWHSLLKLTIDEKSSSRKKDRASIQLAKYIQAAVRLRLSNYKVQQPLVQGLKSECIFMVETAFHHLLLAEQCLLLDLGDKAECHCIDFARLLINSARMTGCRCLEEQSLVFSNARQILPAFLSSQVRLESEIISKRLPSRITLVLGMHRSGTSAVAAILDSLGLDKSKDLIESNEANPTGYWESWGIYIANESLLSDLGSSWDSVRQLPFGWEVTDSGKRWRQALLQNLIEDFPDANHPLVKDPRLCILGLGLEPWYQSNVIESLFVLTLRHPFEVAQSLNIRDGISIVKAIRLWINHVFVSEYQSRTFKRILIQFDVLINEPSLVAERLNKFVFQAEYAPGAEAVTSLKNLIQPDLYRNRLEDIGPSIHREASSSAAECDLALSLFSVLTSYELDDQGLIESVDQLKGLWEVIFTRSG